MLGQASIAKFSDGGRRCWGPLVADVSVCPFSGSRLHCLVAKVFLTIAPFDLDAIPEMSWRVLIKGRKGTEGLGW